MPSVLRKAPYHSFSILYSIIYISTTTGRYLEYTVSIQRVPSATKRRLLLLPVRSDTGSYGTTGTNSLLIRITIDLPLHFERKRAARSAHAAEAKQSTWASSDGIDGA